MRSRLQYMSGRFRYNRRVEAQPLVDALGLRVLRAVRDRALDGYSLLSKTGLAPVQLVDALVALQSKGLVIVKGELAPNAVGDSIIAVPPDAIGDVDNLLGLIRSRAR